MLIIFYALELRGLIILVRKPWWFTTAMLMAKKNVHSSSNKAVSHARFPLGELTRRRRELKETYLSKNAELKDLQKDVQKISKRVCMTSIME